MMSGILEFLRVEKGFRQPSRTYACRNWGLKGYYAVNRVLKWNSLYGECRTNKIDDVHSLLKSALTRNFIASQFQLHYLHVLELFCLIGLQR